MTEMTAMLVLVGGLGLCVSLALAINGTVLLRCRQTLGRIEKLLQKGGVG